MKYIAITETTKPFEKVDNLIYSEEEVLKALQRPYYIDTFKDYEPLPHYTTFEMSEETFKFVESVATIEHYRFGEKKYKINNIEFQILTKEEYAKQL